MIRAHVWNPSGCVSILATMLWLGALTTPAPARAEQREDPNVGASRPPTSYHPPSAPPAWGTALSGNVTAVFPGPPSSYSIRLEITNNTNAQITSFVLDGQRPITGIVWDYMGTMSGPATLLNLTGVQTQVVTAYFSGFDPGETVVFDGIDPDSVGDVSAGISVGMLAGIRSEAIAGGATGQAVYQLSGAGDVVATITFSQPPTCNAGGPYSGFALEPVAFDGTGSTDPGGSIVAWDWDFGDGNQATGSTPSHTYVAAGTYPVTLCVTDNDSLQSCCSATSSIAPARNANPDCSHATASEPLLWPPNHKHHAISIQGVTDPDGDPVTITATSVTQDEPVQGHGDGRTCPDAQIVGGQVAVRAEREGGPGLPGNGRVYVITFTATDGKGGSCNGAVTVCVPHDQSGGACANDGQQYNSLSGCGKHDNLSEAAAQYNLTIGSVTRSGAQVDFELPTDSEVAVGVFDVVGRQVASLERGRLPAGTYHVAWTLGESSSGLYFVRMQAGGLTLTRMVMALR